jgi:hypothetical protein
MLIFFNNYSYVFNRVNLSDLYVQNYLFFSHQADYIIHLPLFFDLRRKYFSH